MAAIREVMTEQLITVEPPTSVAAAVTVMGMQRIGALLVMERERLEGIFTERDLVRVVLRHWRIQPAGGAMDDKKPGHRWPRDTG